MKEFEPHKAGEDKVESHHERNVREEIGMHARMLLRRGMTLFEYNKKTGILKVAEIEQSTVQIKEDTQISGMEPGINTITIKKVLEHSNCMYMQRLNFKNAVRKLKKLGYARIYIQK